MKFIDLFCGIGGFHQALTNLGHKCVYACDIDPKCRETYFENYGIQPEGDIRFVKIKKIPKFDILTAGFTCQPFSKAGNQHGFNDDRGLLFFNICKIVDYHKPKYMILENVKNIVSHDKGNTWKVIRRNIRKLGYNTYDIPLILNVMHFGVPQNRERAIILCKRKDLGNLPDKPIIPIFKTTSINSIIREEEFKENKKYRIKGKLKVSENVWDNFLKILMDNDIDVPKFPIWTDWWDSNGENTTITKKDSSLSNEENANNIKIKQVAFYSKYKNLIDKNRTFYKKNKKILKSWLIESRKLPEWRGAVRKLEWQAGDCKSMKHTIWSSRGSGIRTKKPDYIPTLVAMNTTPIYGAESRFLTPQELLRLQSFSENFIYDEKTIYKQLGNAVNVKMIQRSANFLIKEKPLFKKMR